MTSPKSKEQVVPEDILVTSAAIVMEMEWFNKPTREYDHAVDLVARAILAERERDQWRPISDHRPLHSLQQILCTHSEKKWMRFGFYETNFKRWYYSGTSERSQWAQVEGDAPTHFMPLPTPPEGGEE